MVDLGWRFAREATPTLVKLLDQSPPKELKRALVGVLGDVGARSAAEKIRPLLDDPDLRDLAAYTLARFVDAPSLPRLLAMVADPAEPLRPMLAAVLGAGGVAEVAPTLAELAAAEGQQQYLQQFGLHLLRDPRGAAALLDKLAALAKEGLQVGVRGRVDLGKLRSSVRAATLCSDPRHGNWTTPCAGPKGLRRPAISPPWRSGVPRS